MFTSWVRHRLHRLGIEVSRVDRHPDYQHVRFLNGHHVGLVLDVGASVGGYANRLRKFGYAGRIVSVEPTRRAFEELTRRAAEDARWDAIKCAVGRKRGHVTINVSGRRGTSSSVLPISSRLTDAIPDAQYVSQEEVPQLTLDDIWQNCGAGRDVVFLKLDVQGYEKYALAGGDNVLQHCVAVRLEVSFVELYEGGMLFDEAFELMRDRGFSLMQLEPVLHDDVSGRVLQGDATFVRNDF